MVQQMEFINKVIFQFSEEPVDNKQIESPKRTKTDKKNCKQKNKQKVEHLLSQFSTLKGHLPMLFP